MVSLQWFFLNLVYNFFSYSPFFVTKVLMEGNLLAKKSTFFSKFSLSQIKSDLEINYFSLKLQKCGHFCNSAAGHRLKKDHEMGILVRFSWTWKKEEDKRPVFWPFFQSHVLRGHSLNTLTKFWPFFNRLLSWVDICENLVNVDISSAT